MRDLIVFAVILGGLPFAFWRPFVGLLLFSWLAYMRPQDLSWGMAKSFRFSYYVAITMFSGWLLFETRPFMRWSPAIKWVIAAFTLASLSLFLNTMDNPGRQISRWLDLVKVLAVAFFATGMIDSKRRLDIQLWVIALSFAFFGIKGGLHGLMGGQILRGPGGMLKDNNDLSLALNMNIPILYYLSLSVHRPWIKNGLRIAIALSCVAILATGSRGGFLTMSLVALVFILKSRHRFMGLACGGMAAVLFVIFMPARMRERLETMRNPSQESSAASRLYAWAVARRMIIDNPILGVGFNNFINHYYEYELGGGKRRPGGERAKPHVAHNSYLQVWAEGGTPTFFCFLAMIFSTIFLMRKLRRGMRVRDGPQWYVNYTHMIETSLLAFLVGGMFLNRAHFDLLYHMIALGGVMYYLFPKVLAQEEEKRFGTPTAHMPAKVVHPSPYVLGGAR